jgi:hypothetical protein
MALGYCTECGGRASTEAVACPHCGATDPTGFALAAIAAHSRAAAHPLPPARPANGLAAVLSLMFPGAGQMYKGHVGNGMLWLLVTCIGYIALVLPGLALHALCVFNAASTEPRQRIDGYGL